MDSSKEYPTVTITCETWDGTWIMSKAARISEKYDIPIAINIRKKESIGIDIKFIEGIVAGAIGEEFLRRGADDL